VPRTSATSLALAGNILSGPSLEPSDGLTPEQIGYWKQIVDAFPGGWFAEDHRPLLTELVRHQAIARQLDEQLEQMRKRTLNAATPHCAKQRSIFLQLLRHARAESEIIMQLSVKLRLTPQSQQRSRDAGIARSRSASGPRPWDDRSSDESAEQH
jgi:hypothetical protein